MVRPLLNFRYSPSGGFIGSVLAIVLASCFVAINCDGFNCCGDDSIIPSCGLSTLLCSVDFTCAGEQDTSGSIKQIMPSDLTINLTVFLSKKASSAD
jgi:hypothetical protein